VNKREIEITYKTQHLYFVNSDTRYVGQRNHTRYVVQRNHTISERNKSQMRQVHNRGPRLCIKILPTHQIHTQHKKTELNAQ
jgi:hypothetical protein